MQAMLLNPEICIVVDNGITFNSIEGKADVSSHRKAAVPGALMASERDTTGILDHGMHTKG